MSKKIFLFLIFCTAISKVSLGNNDFDVAKNSAKNTTISIELSSKKQFIFNYKEHFGTSLNFQNPNDDVQYIKKSFLLSKPTLFSYIIDPLKNNFRCLLVMPGDSIVLSDNGKKIEFSTSFKDYLENIIDIPPLFYQFNPLLINEFKKVNISDSFNSFQKSYLNNERRIDSLDLNETLFTVLKNFNTLIKYRMFSYTDQNALKPNDTVLIDSITKCMVDDMDKVNMINTTIKEEISRYLIKWDFLKTNKFQMKDFWTDVNNVSTHIANSTFYYDHLLTWLQFYFLHDYKELISINLKLRKVDNPNLAIKSVIKLTNILVKTSSNFIDAKRELESIDNGRFLYLFANEKTSNHETRNINQIAPATLVDVNEGKFLFKHILSKKKSIYLIDFWASWCIPCLEDYPLLSKAKQQLKDTSISFISISIDDEKSKHSWIKKLKELGAFSDANQYLLKDAKSSPLRQFFNIDRIPRYLVISENGDVLSESFFRPSDTRFVNELKMITQKSR